MSATVPGRMRRRYVRLGLMLALAALAAGVFVATAAALAFSDDSCDNSKPCRPPTGTVGFSYSHTLKAMPDTGNGPPYSFVLLSGSLPPGLSLSSSGPITGTPTQSGTWTFWVELQDNPKPASDPCCPGVPNPFWCKTRGTCAQRDFTIKVDPGLRIVTNTLPQGASVGAPYSATLEAQLITNLNPPTGTTPPNLAWSIIGGSLPPGLTLGNGVISGTPTAEGTYSFQVQAQLDATRKHSQTYSMTVRQPLKITAPKPFATSPVPTIWEVGVPFSGKLTPSGGSGTYTLALTGSLPTGLALGADGSITGTPRAAGSFRAVIRLSDNETRTLDYQVNFGIVAKLEITTTSPLRPGKVGKRYVAKLKTTGGTLPRAWRVTVGPLPRGMRLDRSTGILSGTPTKAGTYRITVQVTDGLKVVATKKLRLDVLDA